MIIYQKNSSHIDASAEAIDFSMSIVSLRDLPAGEGTLDNLSAWQDLEALRLVGALDDVHCPMFSATLFSFCPAQELSAKSAAANAIVDGRVYTGAQKHRDPRHSRHAP